MMNNPVITAQSTVTEILVLKGDVNKAVLSGLRHSKYWRDKGQPRLVRIRDGKQHLLNILPQGDIEELKGHTLKVSMLDRLAFDATVGEKLSPRQANAIKFARRIIEVGGVS